MEKILHVMFASQFHDNTGYQENLLLKKQVELGYNVTMLSFDDSLLEKKEYENSDGGKIIFLPSCFNRRARRLKLVSYINLYRNHIKFVESNLQEIQPDIIFIHGLQSVDSLKVANYAKKNKIKLFADNHNDYYNAHFESIKQRFIHKTVYRYCARTIASTATKVWGVTPWRVAFMKDVYGLKDSKVGLLVMGGDEAFIDNSKRIDERKQIFNMYNIPEDAKVVVTGGKIDKTKNIHLLIKAVSRLKNENIYLLFFGKFDVEMDLYCRPLIKDNIIYAGWMSPNDVYKYFMAADIVAFPGTHSVLWEQACACGVPGIFKDWDGGFNHVMVNDNAILLNTITSQAIENALKEVLLDEDKLSRMKMNAQGLPMKIFSYKNIALKSIGISE